MFKKRVSIFKNEIWSVCILISLLSGCTGTKRYFDNKYLVYTYTAKSNYGIKYGFYTLSIGNVTYVIKSEFAKQTTLSPEYAAVFGKIDSPYNKYDFFYKLKNNNRPNNIDGKYAVEIKKDGVYHLFLSPRRNRADSVVKVLSLKKDDTCKISYDLFQYSYSVYRKDTIIKFQNRNIKCRLYIGNESGEYNTLRCYDRNSFTLLWERDDYIIYPAKYTDTVQYRNAVEENVPRFCVLRFMLDTNDVKKKVFADE